MYHMCKDIWETVVCVLAPGDFYDKNAVDVGKDRRIIGHLPWKVSHIYALFLKISATVCCTVTTVSLWFNFSLY